jgi:hypothetical protein
MIYVWKNVLILGILIDSLGFFAGKSITNIATAPYFYGSILLQARKSKILVVLTYVPNK